MNVLVTAGNTRTPIDRVRCITNIFTGRTGAAIAREAHHRGHAVTLLTSHPEAVEGPPLNSRWAILRYDTFDDLHAQMARLVPGGDCDAIIHCAAVSDYRAAGVYGSAPHTRFRPEDGTWESLTDEPPALVDRTAGKVKSDEPELWLRLVRTPKLIDFIRGQWGFRGVLVKFKLEVGVTEEQLLAFAERSRRQSSADLMVANTLEGASTWAFFGPVQEQFQRISRRELAAQLLGEVERLHEERTRG